jgi:protein-S-isoprenylcysteine O-methyltransferase Ste14
MSHAPQSQTAVPPASEGAGVIAPPPLLFLSGLAAGFALQALLPATPLPVAVSVPIGVGLIVAGTVLARGFFRAFKRAGTPVSPYRDSTTLVTCGPYRVTRNPAYLGMALTYAGIAVVAATLWVLVPLAVVVALIDRGVIVREERYLQRTFGKQYSQYKRRTRRWL